MDLKLHGRTALVAGASAGLGEAIAISLAEEGAHLALCARNPERLEAIAARARQAGSPRVETFVMDLADPDSVRATVEAASKGFGTVDVAVLNGGGPKAGKFSDVTLRDWDCAYHLLLRGMLALASELVPPMRLRRWGRVVALTSTAVKQPIETLVLSNAFRTGLVAALRTLATEVARDGVTVNCIATGRVDTARLRALYGGDESALRKAGEEIPIGHIASPQEFAPIVTFLCGEPARYITGQTISVDGGLTRGLFG